MHKNVKHLTRKKLNSDNRREISALSHVMHYNFIIRAVVWEMSDGVKQGDWVHRGRDCTELKKSWFIQTNISTTAALKRLAPFSACECVFVFIQLKVNNVLT